MLAARRLHRLSQHLTTPTPSPSSRSGSADRNKIVYDELRAQNDAGWIHSRTSEHEDQLVQFREQVRRLPLTPSPPRYEYGPAPPDCSPCPPPASSRTRAARAF